MHQLIDEVIELLITLGHSTDVEKVSYSDVFIQNSGIDILNTDFDDLKSIAKSHGLNSDFHWIEDLQTLLFIHLIEPKIAQIPICIIYDYPKEQAALAQINGPLAHRFELYINGVEIANGYQELQSSEDYRFRFNNELIKRKKLSKTTPLIDKQFLNELKDGGLPYCSGVAIGIERLFSAKSL
jgi:lysyl-tRNA synthetase class 2